MSLQLWASQVLRVQEDKDIIVRVPLSIDDRAVNTSTAQVWRDRTNGLGLVTPLREGEIQSWCTEFILQLVNQQIYFEDSLPIPSPTSGEDLIEVWETFEEAITIQNDFISNDLVLPGPNYSRNQRKDSGDTYVWLASAAKVAEIRTWITNFRNLSSDTQRNATTLILRAPRPKPVRVSVPLLITNRNVDRASAQQWKNNEIGLGEVTSLRETGAQSWLVDFRIFTNSLASLWFLAQDRLRVPVADGQDLIQNWENYEQAIILQNDHITDDVIIPGPNFSGNAAKDSGDGYAWRPAASKYTEIQTWITAFRALSSDTLRNATRLILQAP